MKPTDQMCVVEVGHTSLLLPALKGLELVKLLQGNAARGEWDYGHSNADHLLNFRVKPLGEIRMTTIDASRLVGLQLTPAKRPTRSAPLKLSRD